MTDWIVTLQKFASVRVKADSYEDAMEMAEYTDEEDLEFGQIYGDEWQITNAEPADD